MVDYRGSGKDNTSSTSGNGKFVCPSDRQLALRAKLHTGWSAGRPQATLRPEEQAAIISVIQRNEMLEMAERQRVGKLVEKVEKIKQRAAECGPRFCRLCGQSFGLLGPSKLICDDCQKPVCSKCSIEINARSGKFPNKSPDTSPNKSSTKITRTTLMLASPSKEVWLCKICSETREMWKKSGAWFFKGLPRYELPQRANSTRNSMREVKVKPVKTTKLGMQIEDSSEEEEEGDQELKNSFRIGNGSSSRYFFNDDTMLALTSGGNPKKSPISPYSRQTSSSESSHNQQNLADWDVVSLTASTNPGKRESNLANHRRGSLSSNWSMSESSSGNGNQCVTQMCKEAPLGWLELSIHYIESTHSLDCTIHRARDLPPMDSSGLADPFCKLNIVTEEGSVRQSRWMKTKTVHKTKNPEFNDAVQFLGVEPEELGNSVLYVVLLDDDKYGHDFLGATKLLLSVFTNSGRCRMSVPLGAEDQFTTEAGSSGPWPRGQILLALSYNTKRRALMVNLKKCVNLVSMDSNGYSDPFIKLQLKPDSHRKKHKTSIKWRTLNPIFNEEFAFETRPNDLDKQSLIITVWDKDLGKSNDFLGSLILGPNSKGRRLKQWKDCVRLPDHFHEQWHCLSSEVPGNH